MPSFAACVWENLALSQYLQFFKGRLCCLAFSLLLWNFLGFSVLTFLKILHGFGADLSNLRRCLPSPIFALKVSFIAGLSENLWLGTVVTLHCLAEIPIKAGQFVLQYVEFLEGRFFLFICVYALMLWMEMEMNYW